MPFIIRGVKLWGINSVDTSKKRRDFLWGELPNLIDFSLLEKSVKEISLDELLNTYSQMLEAKTSARYLINLSK